MTNRDKEFDYFIPIESSFALDQFLISESDFQAQVLKFLASGQLSCNLITHSESGLPPFTRLISYASEIQQDLLIEILKTSKLSFLLEDDRISRFSSCCNASCSSVNFFSASSFLLLDEGRSVADVSEVRSLRYSEFYIPERGRFSIHDSFLPIIISDLEEGEMLYPIMDITNMVSSFPDFSNVVQVYENTFSEVFHKSDVMFCSQCKRLAKCFRNTTKFIDLAHLPEEKTILNLLKVGDYGHEEFLLIKDPEFIRFLGVAYEILSADGPCALVGVFRTLSSRYRRDLIKLISYLRDEGTMVYVVDSYSVVGASARASTVKRGIPLSRFRERFNSSLDYLVNGKKPQSDYFLSIDEIAPKQQRVRQDTYVGNYIGLMPAMKNLFLLHPVAKMRGLDLDDLAVTSSRFNCERCSGKGCEVCFNSGFSEYLDDIEIHGVSFRKIFNMTIVEVLHAFGFVKEVYKIGEAYKSVALGSIKINAKVRELSQAQFALIQLIKDGIPILRKGGTLHLKNILTDISLKALFLLRDYLDSICKASGAKIVVEDRSELVKAVLNRVK